MNFEVSEKTKELQNRLQAFMDSHVYPNEEKFQAEIAQARWKPTRIVEELKAKARHEGLWNLFLPQDKNGAGLSNLEYAPLCEIMGRSHIAPEIFNCSAPDTGNMEVLARYGTAEQKEKWLKPLLAGEIRSCFAMTEPDVASSDATNISASIVADGDSYVIKGRKWWSSGAGDPRCKVAILMGKTDPSAAAHKQQSMILVPLDTPGVKIVRMLTVFGYDHAPHGHAEIQFDDVRVPKTNMLLGEGRGFEIAQGRLGPGRIHHCMRCIGVAERALETMCRRVQSRVAFGRALAEQGTIRADIAMSRIEIEQARLLTLKAADMMDKVGNKAARSEIAMIKVVAPNVALRVLDRAIQAHGGAGVSQDTFLASAWAGVRSLRLADGPDEVHIESIAKWELGRNNSPALQAMMVALPHELLMKGMVHVSRTTLGTRIVLLVLSAMIGACSHRTTDLSPAFTFDLQPWGYSNEPSGPPTASYSSLAFLSDDIVLVVINERRFTQAVEVSLTDEPASKVLLFNIRSNLLVTTAQIPVEKQPGAVQISEGRHFSGWNESGFSFVTSELKCTAPARFCWSYYGVSEGPCNRGGRVGSTGQKLLDGLSLHELATYPQGNPAVVPDDAVLLRYAGHSFL